MANIATSDEDRSEPPSLARSMAIAWLIAGTLDIAIALTYYPLSVGARPLLILQGIASGLLGAEAFQGGVGTAALGLVCHYLIALFWTLIFFAAYPRIGPLSRSASVTAVLYGTFVSAMMTFVVLPLSAVRPRPFVLASWTVATVILWVSIGLPLAVVAGRHYAGRRRER